MQNKPIPTVIGIDIGAYTTKVSIVDRGTVDILTNEANERETPSIVGYGDGVRKIGEIGNAKLKSNYKNTVISPNRYLGLQRNNALTQ
jgi:molecular chaperone DnaK (HSP70)